MDAPNASSSSVVLARELSRRLSPSRPGRAVRVAIPKPAGTYLAFSAPESARPRSQAPSPPPAPVEARALPAVDPTGLRDWESLLRWCLSAASAKTVFVMDDQGFVIAKEGSWSYEDAEAMGTQVMVALERFDEMDTFSRRAHALIVRFRSFWLTGLRVPTESKDSFTLGILGTDQTLQPILEAIEQQVAASIRYL